MKQTKLKIIKRTVFKLSRQTTPSQGTATTTLATISNVKVN